MRPRTIAVLATLLGAAAFGGRSCARPRFAVPGTVVASSPDGDLCAVSAYDVQPVPAGFDFNGGGACRFCPERVSVRFQASAPDLPGTWGLVGATLVARHLEQTGCGGSGCDYALTAWWRRSGRWVVVRGEDADTDDLFGGGPPFRTTWETVAAACSR